MAGLGVQMLFGFLLALPFTMRFTELDGAQRDLYRVSILGAALSTALLISPVAYHRWVFRKHEKARLLKTANVVAILGLGTVALSVSSSVWLVLSFVGESVVIVVASVFVIFSFYFLWFALPIFERAKANPEASD